MGFNFWRCNTNSNINECNRSLSSDLNRILREHGFENIIRSEALGRIVEGISTNGTGGKAPDLGERIGDSGHINLIPSKVKSACHEELLVLCYDRDNLDERLRKMLYHAGITCRDINRKVLFITSYWLPRIVNEHIKEVERKRQDGVEIVFVLFTKNGATEIPA